VSHVPRDRTITLLLSLREKKVVQSDDGRLPHNKTSNYQSADNSVITSGSIKSEVYLVGVPVYSETDDLCSKHACPVE